MTVPAHHPPGVRRRRGLLTAACFAATAALLAAGTAATAGPQNPGRANPRIPAHAQAQRFDPLQTKALPAPQPAPTSRPTQPRKPASTGQPTTSSLRTTDSTAARAPSGPSPKTTVRSKSWGKVGAARTLVLYDSTGGYSWLGEFYGIAAGNLGTHFGQVTAVPVVDYQAGMMQGYTGVVYVGSTYNELLPTAFLDDVRTGSTPVLWSGYNVWQLSGDAGSQTALDFADRYGWDASTSYIDTEAFTGVTYQGTALTRHPDAGGVVAPHVVDPGKVEVVGTIECAATCAPIAQTTGSSFPWAVRSANLTYIGEVPLSYMSESDRYLAYADLFFPLLAPGTAPSKKAAVRIEDVSPVSDPVVLRQFVDYLSGRGVPFSIGVIPRYVDPTGYYNGGTPQTVNLSTHPSWWPR